MLHLIKTLHALKHNDFYPSVIGTKKRDFELRDHAHRLSDNRYNMCIDMRILP